MNSFQLRLQSPLGNTAHYMNWNPAPSFDTESIETPHERLRGKSAEPTAPLHAAAGWTHGARERFSWQRAAAAGGDVATAAKMWTVQRLNLQPGHGRPGCGLLLPALLPAGPSDWYSPRHWENPLQV